MREARWLATSDANLVNAFAIFQKNVKSANLANMTLEIDTRLGFVGTGVMGSAMASHLKRAGYPLFVYTRTREKAEPLVKLGATVVSNLAEVARNCRVAFTMVGMPSDVEEVYFGSQGLIENSAPGTYLVDMTTSSPSLAKRIFEAGKARGLRCLDAPVSGGDIGAREARLSIMVGGEEAAYNTLLPLFELMGKTIVHQGPAGSGQHTKLANQIAIASTMVGVCEALAYAKASGLDPKVVLQSISGGAAGSWTLSNLAPRILNQDFAPGFFVKHFIKDMRLALESGAELGTRMPGTDLALSLYEELAKQGGLEEGTQALFRLYE